MRTGVVVSIRLNTEDVMAAIDIVNSAKSFFPGMSISGCAALAMSIAFETMRQQEKIPRRTEFDYGEMIAAFPDRKNNRQKRAFADKRYVDTIQRTPIPALEDKDIPAPPECKDWPSETQLKWITASKEVKLNWIKNGEPV